MNNKNIITEKELIKGSKMISMNNNNEIEKFKEFCINISKDTTKKNINKIPFVRIRIIAYLIQSGLLENGYVEGYEISEIIMKDPELKNKYNSKLSKGKKNIEEKLNSLDKNDPNYENYVKELTKESNELSYKIKNSLASSIRKELSMIERLGYFKTYLCKGLDCSKIPYQPKETIKEYSNRIKKARKAGLIKECDITQKVIRYTFITDKFYQFVKSINLELNNVYTNDQIDKFDKIGQEFKNRNRFRVSI